MAAMINDMIYSTEQRLLHHYEGFPSKQLIQNSLFEPADTTVDCGNIRLLPNLLPGASDSIIGHGGEFGVFKMALGKPYAGDVAAKHSSVLAS